MPWKVHSSSQQSNLPEPQPVTYTLGVRHVFSGSAQDTIDTFKDIYSDIDSVHQLMGESAASGKILYKLKNSMSDRHAAEKLFAELLHEYRAQILPEITENWSAMTSLEQENSTNMNNFFCGLHYMIALADCAEEAIKLFEKDSELETIPSSSGLIRSFLPSRVHNRLEVQFYFDHICGRKLDCTNYL